jgi:formylglycine-generating enzyme required for sulfatase activity
MIFVKPGTFVMGSPADENGRGSDEGQHRVTLTKSFLMGATHVTVGQFAAFVKDTGYRTAAEIGGAALEQSVWTPGANWRNPGFDQGDDHPVVCVNWGDSIAFCEWLSKKEGRHYRLPTEAEWEYTARAGTQSAYWWGDSPNNGEGCANCLDQTAKKSIQGYTDYFSWSDGYVHTSPVGIFRPNAWGLYDMIGNAFEWCGDWQGAYPNGSETDPRGPDSGLNRVLRGGGWNVPPLNCRCARRHGIPPGDMENNVGFRVVLEAN